MQQGSIIQAERKIGPDAWEFRWREPGPDGKRKHRRMVIGRIEQLADESAAGGRISALHLDINFWDARLKGKPLTISELAEHYRQRELKPDTVWKTYSTKLTYEGYLCDSSSDDSAVSFRTDRLMARCRRISTVANREKLLSDRCLKAVTKPHLSYLGGVNK